MIPALLSVIIAFSIMASATAEVVLTNLSVSTNTVKSEQAFEIAEAGLNYYLWLLDHNPTDYEDGQTGVILNPTLGYGPFVHYYDDQNLNVDGTYTLWVKPPPNGSDLVTVRSIGQSSNSNIVRTLQAQIGSPSFASYGVVSNSDLWFGNDETADGPIFSNQGIRMDGPNTSTVASANSTYIPSQSYGGDGHTSEPGVWCSTTVISPINCNTRSKSDWVYPNPTVNFNTVSGALCTMKKVAFANNSSTSGLNNLSNPCNQTPSTLTASYLPERSSSYNITRGYLIKLNNNNTYNLYDVNSVNDTLTPYTSAMNLQLVNSGVALPSSGVIFAEDNVWVMSNPTFTGRLSIAAGRMTSNSSASYANITIADPIVYTAKDGSDELGLVAQNSVLVAPYAPPATGAFTFEIDGALLAENGNVWYPDTYVSNANRCTRGWTSSNQQLLFYGSVATLQNWTWNWLDGSSQCGDASYDPVNGYISGIENTTTEYDYNLEFGAPPSYPTTAGNVFISWREVLTAP